MYNRRHMARMESGQVKNPGMTYTPTSDRSAECSVCGAKCAGVCSIGKETACADCFADHVLGKADPNQR